MKIGTFIPGRFQPIVVGLTSVPHEVYEIHAETTPMTTTQSADVAVRLAAVHVEGMVVLGVEAEGPRVRMQVTGSPFTWAPLLAILPAIIVPLMVLVVGVIIALRIPDWAYAALPLGAGLGIMLYLMYTAKSKGGK